VTDRDEVVAEPRPTRRRVEEADSLDELFESVAALGEITPANLRKPRGERSAMGLSLAMAPHMPCSMKFAATGDLERRPPAFT
jgi:hypothetical protein